MCVRGHGKKMICRVIRRDNEDFGARENSRIIPLAAGLINKTENALNEVVMVNSRPSLSFFNGPICFF